MIAPDFAQLQRCLAGDRDRVAVRQRHRLPDADPNGSNGGGASLVMDGQRDPYGTVLVINHILMATIVKPSG